MRQLPKHKKKQAFKFVVDDLDDPGYEQADDGRDVLEPAAISPEKLPQRLSRKSPELGGHPRQPSFQHYNRKEFMEETVDEESDASRSSGGQSASEKKNDFSGKFSSNPIDKASIKNYKLLKTIGKGLYSKVKLAASKTHSSKFYAIKIIKRHDVEKISLKVFKQIMLNEVTLLRKLHHPNIIQLIEYNCDGEIVVKESGKTIQIYFIVLELVEQGDLFSYIKVQNDRGGFSEPFARYYFQQLLSSIEYLHNNAGIVHRDLKPENILLNHRYDLKIADFGLSTNKEGKYGLGIHHSQVGTRQYQAPEILRKQYYRGESADVFSMGVILFIMATGTLPYLGEAQIKDPLYQYVKSKQPEEFWGKWRQLFKSEMELQEIENEREGGWFTSDEGELFEPLTQGAEKSLLFRTWIETLYFIAKIFQTLFQAVSLVLYPVFLLLWYLCFYLALVPGLVRESAACVALFGRPPKTQDTFSSVSNARTSDDFSPEFKDLVFKMIAYSMVDRPSLSQIRNHPWLQGPVPSQEQVKQAMYRLKTKFIEQEVEQQSTKLRNKNDQVRSRPLPKSFKDYAIFCIRTNNVEALLKGLVKLGKIYFSSYARWLLRCHYCRKKQNNTKWIHLPDSKMDQMRKQKIKQNSSSLPPIWWQNSKVSYSFFASGSSSFLNFSMSKHHPIPAGQSQFARQPSGTQETSRQEPGSGQQTAAQQSSLGCQSKNSYVGERKSSDLSQRQTSQVSYLEEVATYVTQQSLSQSIYDTPQLQQSHLTQSGKLDLGVGKVMIRNNLIDKAKHLGEDFKGDPGKLQPGSLDHISSRSGASVAPVGSQQQYTATVKEEDPEQMDETEDELNVKANIIKNRIRRLIGGRAMRQCSKIESIDRDNIEDLLHFEENLQDADSQRHRVENLEKGDSLLTQISSTKRLDQQPQSLQRRFPSSSRFNSESEVSDKLLYVKSHHHQQQHQQPMSDSASESEGPANLEEDNVDDESEELPVSPPQMIKLKSAMASSSKLKVE